MITAAVHITFTRGQVTQRAVRLTGSQQQFTSHSPGVRSHGHEAMLTYAGFGILLTSDWLDNAGQQHITQHH